MVEIKMKWADIAEVIHVAQLTGPDTTALP